MQKQQQQCPYLREMKERLTIEYNLIRHIDDPESDYDNNTIRNIAIMPDSGSEQQQQQQQGAFIKRTGPAEGLQASEPNSPRRCANSDADDANDETNLIVVSDNGAGCGHHYEEVCHFYHHPVARETVWPKNAKTSLFIVLSFMYANLLIVTCIGYIFADVLTHAIPLYYYEGFFTYLYAVAIFFLLYIFCFLLQECACCCGSGSAAAAAAAAAVDKPADKTKKKQEAAAAAKRKAKEAKEAKKKSDAAAAAAAKAAKADKKQPDKEAKSSASPAQSPRSPPSITVDDGTSNAAASAPGPASPQRDQPATSEYDSATLPLSPPQQQQQQQQQPLLVAIANAADLESGNNPAAQQHLSPLSHYSQVDSAAAMRKRKTTFSSYNHGGIFLRIGAIVFGLGTMIYIGLELGSMFEIPFDSPCYEILREINPGLQLIFTFLQMYFIFMNARLNIHRFKAISRFGLMHIVATNICIWIRTFVYEYLKDLTAYFETETGTNSTSKIGTGSGGGPVALLPYSGGALSDDRDRFLRHTLKSYLLENANATFGKQLAMPAVTTHLPEKVATAATTAATTAASAAAGLLSRSFRDYTESAPAEALQAAATTAPLSSLLKSTIAATVATTGAGTESAAASSITTTAANYFQNLNLYPEETAIDLNNSVLFDGVTPAALIAANDTIVSCNRIDIMGTIVQDLEPYLYPFVINNCLIATVVIYVMYIYIGRYQRSETSQDLEHKLEIMLSRRAVALAQASAQTHRIDCVGTSKGLFFGLLLMVATAICSILFFVLINHGGELSMMAIYLSELSHCTIIALGILATLLGFIRIRKLKYRVEQVTNFNDLLLRISGFGLLLYMTMNVVSGAMNARHSHRHLLVVVTSALSIVQVVLQLLFVTDIARRRVHLPEHDRTKPGRQIVTFLLIANLTLSVVYLLEIDKTARNPIQLRFYGFVGWRLIEKTVLPLAIFHRFHSAITLAEVWKISYKAWLE